MTDIVYFIQSETGPIKIGYSKRFKERFSALRGASPHKLSLLAKVPGGRKLEKHLHKFLAPNRIMREWFQDCEDVRNAIDLVVSEGPSAVGFLEEKDETEIVTQAQQYVDRARQMADLLWDNTFEEPGIPPAEKACRIGDQFQLPSSLIYGLRYRPPKSVGAHDYYSLALVCRDLEITAINEIREAFTVAREVAFEFEDRIKPSMEALKERRGAKMIDKARGME